MAGSRKASKKDIKELKAAVHDSGGKRRAAAPTKTEAHKLQFLLLVIILTLCVSVGFVLLKKEPEPTKLATLPVASTAQYGDTPEDLCAVFEDISVACSVSYEYSDKYSRGELITQDPASGTEASSVALVYSEGPANVEVPLLAGSKSENIEKILWQAGLKLGDITTEDAISPEGTILKTSIEPGEKVASGTSIALTVSTGVITIPNWLGKTRDFAESEANNLGLTVVFKEVKSDKTPGIVVKQTPPTGEIDKDSTIILEVSTSATAKKVKIPKVIGLTQIDAISLLASKGFTKIKTVMEKDSSVKNEKVVKVSPGVGEKINPNDTITLTVKKAS